MSPRQAERSRQYWNERAMLSIADQMRGYADQTNETAYQYARSRGCAPKTAPASIAEASPIVTRFAYDEAIAASMAKLKKTDTVTLREHAGATKNAVRRWLCRMAKKGAVELVTAGLAKHPAVWQLTSTKNTPSLAGRARATQ